MPMNFRPRRRFIAALPALLVVLSACSAEYPNSIFTNFTEFNREIGSLMSIMIWLGTFVFIFVEALLIYALFRFRRKSDNDRPEHVHGNTTLEILWTAIPALILVFIAVPTVSTIFKTQAKAKADALQVEVIGHQWWWEFRYPQYGVTTANELYLPVGRTVNFSLKTADVLHSFWIPQMGGKRDLIANRENFLWFTPDSVGQAAWNGTCVEYCGSSHANMRFKMFSVTPANFESWAKHQASAAAFGAVAATAAPGTDTTVRVAPAAAPSTALGSAYGAGGSSGSVAADPHAGHDMGAMPPSGAGVQQAGFEFPRKDIPKHVVPDTPLPATLAYDDALTGDAERGRQIMTQGQGGCLGCHMIKGNPNMMGVIGPNLTHLASRSTIGGGLFPNDTRHLARWLKNSRAMKPGIIMPTLGKGEYDPVTKTRLTQGLTDQQVADMVAYLQALK